MPNDPRLDRFLNFSSDVTAFRTLELSGTGQVGPYLEAIDAIVGAAVMDELLAAYEDLRRLDDVGHPRTAALRKTIFGNQKFGPIARGIVKLWYVGTWYALPAEWHAEYGPKPDDRTFVVSTSAYKEGLLWPAIGAHPPGAKAPGFGSWKNPPRIPLFDATA
jgi:hypothetical protein